MNTLGRFCALKSSLWYSLIHLKNSVPCLPNQTGMQFIREYLPNKVVVLA